MLNWDETLHVDYWAKSGFPPIIEIKRVRDTIKWVRFCEEGWQSTDFIKKLLLKDSVKEHDTDFTHNGISEKNFSTGYEHINAKRLVTNIYIVNTPWWYLK